MSYPDRFATPAGISRNTVIVGSVIALHVVGIWALQSGLVRKAAEVIVPAELLSQFIAPPAPPQVTPPPPAPPPPPKPAPKVAPRPAPMPVAIKDPAPTPNAPATSCAAARLYRATSCRCAMKTATFSPNARPAASSRAVPA